MRSTLAELAAGQQRIEAMLRQLLQAQAAQDRSRLSDAEHRALSLMLPRIGAGTLDSVRCTAVQLLAHLREHHPDILVALEEAIGALDGDLPQVSLSALLRRATGISLSGFTVRAGRKVRGVQQWCVLRG